MWGRPVDDECLQAFSSTIVQREKDDKILKRLRARIKETHFKSFEMPPEDYSAYLRVREMIGGTTRRLLNNIIAASNFEFEDSQKMYGVLDLADAIQVIASKTPRNDIFQLDEIMKQSFSIVILLDVSRSMGISPQENRARAICIAEAAKDVIPDSNAWAFYAFSDRLYVIKDASESYSRRVRSRIGGVPFEGTTYMPDAMSAAAQFFRGSSEEQRIMFILSDGYPYGYTGIREELDNLKRVYEGLGLIMIGIGFDTEKMKELFTYNASVYSQKDLVKKVGDIFLSASAEELL
jgi:cobalamin biosynthesis protein CobT